MSGFLYALVGWGAAFCSWVLGSVAESGAEPPGTQKRRARAAMSRDLFGPKPFTLVRGGKR